MDLNTPEMSEKFLNFLKEMYGEDKIVDPKVYPRQFKYQKDLAVFEFKLRLQKEASSNEQL